jgi:hypothetical protein
MSYVLSDMFFVDVFKVLNSPKKLHNGLLFDRLHFDKFAQLLTFKRWGIFWLLNIFVWDFLKKGNELFFHFFDRIAGAQDCVDSVGAVLVFIELDQIVSNLWMDKGLIVTYRESTIGSLS